MSNYEMRAALDRARERAGQGVGGSNDSDDPDLWVEPNRKFDVINEKLVSLSEAVPMLREHLMTWKFLKPDQLQAARHYKVLIEQTTRAISTLVAQIFASREVYVDPSVTLGQTWKNKEGHKAVALRENPKRPGAWDMSNGETWNIRANREDYQFIDSVLPQEGERR